MRKAGCIALLSLALAALGATHTARAAIPYFPGPAHDSETELLVPNANATTGNCGVERWAVKTGTDQDAGQVDLAHGTATTVGQLGAIQPPASLPSGRRVRPTETRTFTLRATLTRYKLEADSDYHLVIRDGSGHTMIAEVPDPACVGVASPFLGDIQVVRQLFDDRYVATGSFRDAAISVCLSGVGFFDFLHGQTGSSPNGIEIHPVLGLQFAPATCPAWGGNAVPPTAAFLAPTAPASVPAGDVEPFRIRCTAGSNPLAAWRLDFGDGTAGASGILQGTASETAAATHAYARGGVQYVATLTCIDAQGTASVPVTLAVTVKPQSAGGGSLAPWTLLALVPLGILALRPGATGNDAG